MAAASFADMTRQAPPKGCNLLVAGLSRQITNTALRAMFSPFGSLLSAMVMLDFRTGVSRGFGFVLFEFLDDANEAIRVMHLRNVAGGRLRVVPSVHGAQAVITNAIFARHIPAAFTRNQIHTLFSQYGTIVNLSISSIPGNDMAMSTQASKSMYVAELTRPGSAYRDGQARAVGTTVQYATITEAREALEALHGANRIGPIPVSPHSTDIPIGLEIGLVETAEQLEAYDAQFFAPQLSTVTVQEVSIDLLKPLLIKYEESAVARRRRAEALSAEQMKQHQFVAQTEQSGFHLQQQQPQMVYPAGIQFIPVVPVTPAYQYSTLDGSANPYSPQGNIVDGESGSIQQGMSPVFFASSFSPNVLMPVQQGSMEVTSPVLSCMQWRPALTDCWTPVGDAHVNPLPENVQEETGKG